MEKLYTYIIGSEHVFDSVSDTTYPGYVCVKDRNIVKVEKGKPNQEELEKAEKVIQLEDELIMPGIIDTHTFFTGYAIFHVGVDVSEVQNSEQAREAIENYIRERETSIILGHGWNPENWDKEEGEKFLEETYPDLPVILFAADRGSCIMNTIARNRYKFDSESCYPESYYRIMQEYLNDREFIDGERADYTSMMNARGVTTVKEMGFDNFYGFTDVLKEKEEDLNIRFFFMSQPVGAPMNLEYAKAMREKFIGDKVRFSGFNRMTDGTIADKKGCLKETYENENFNCAIEIDWDEIERDVLVADKDGFRWSLHCQGNQAVQNAASIFSKCEMENGKLKNRQALTDMEYSDAEDIQKLGEIGACAELYFQIMSLDPGEVILENIKNTIGKERGKNYWNRAKMLQSGMTLCGATDLPLMLTSLQESIYYSCFGKLEGGRTFQVENTIPIPAMLKAWTIGGATNLAMENKLGTLESGKLADITVFDRDFTELDADACRCVKNIMTMVDGEIVFENN